METFEATVIGLMLSGLMLILVAVMIALPFVVISINSKVRRMEDMMDKFLVSYREDKDIIELTERVS